jgi:hypothetical protein
MHSSQAFSGNEDMVMKTLLTPGVYCKKSHQMFSVNVLHGLSMSFPGLLLQTTNWVAKTRNIVPICLG